MWPPPVDGDGALILRDLGFRWMKAEEAREIVFEYRGGGGDGLQLTAQAGADTLHLWVPQAAWCAWVSELLPIGAWEDVADDLGPVLAQWTLLPLQSSLVELSDAAVMTGLVDAKLAPCHIDDAPGWWITLQEGARLLPMKVVQAPAGWLFRLAAGMRLLGPVAHVESLALTVLAGWVRLPASTWGTLRSGDVVMLEPGADPDTGRLWARFGELCLTLSCAAAADLGDAEKDSATTVFRETSNTTQGADESDSRAMRLLAAHIEPDWRTKASGPGDVQCVLAEMGQVHLPASQFAAMALDGTITPRLSRNRAILLRDPFGNLLATGGLVQVGRRLAVCIGDITTGYAQMPQIATGKVLAMAADQVDT